MFANKTLVTFLLISSVSFAQSNLEGKVTSSNGEALNCMVGIKGTKFISELDSSGNFKIQNIPTKTYSVNCYCSGQETISKEIDLKAGDNRLDFAIKVMAEDLDEVAVIGTIKETVRAESPIVTDIYDKKYFLKNPSPSIIDVMNRMNGVRPQVNCNVCGTGDIHINGLEGPYTLIVLDGIPIMGGLSSVYGLSGIPSFLLDKIEVTKGPASSIYGSEAVAGVIHAFTKRANKRPEIYFQSFGTSHGEINTDFGINIKVSKKASVFTSGNYFLMQNKMDHDGDNFTDVPLQNRISIYQKWKIDREENRVFTISGRYINEDRWGGDMNWTNAYRGGDSLYAESIKTQRYELNTAYQLPFKEKLLFLGHVNHHIQDSYYGDTPFDAKQILAFGQLTWDKSFHRNSLMAGANVRNVHYNDNTSITTDSLGNSKPLNTFLPGIFVQDEWKINTQNTLLGSARLDYSDVHKFIFTPRLAYMLKFNSSNAFRLHAGTGFRVVNLFSEDHAALTGARKIVIEEKLNPEQSKSLNASYSNSIFIKNKWKIETDVSVFYTYFSNRIAANYDEDPNAIIYRNLKGYAESKGFGVDVKLDYNRQLSFQTGFTFMKVSETENKVETIQMLTERMSGNWTLSYSFLKIPLSIDYTGNVIGPMRLPLLSELDPRPEYSSTYSIQNVQVTYTLSEKFVLFGGVKNLLNWTPSKNLPFLISRTNDPFDKEVQYDAGGQVVPTTNNPYGLSFDPSYVYASNQGIRGFIGFRMKIDYKKKTKVVD
jgi:outer membrane receptor for ferrienterochelin and colicins